MADLENIEKKLDLILQNQHEIESKINNLEKSVKKIESDIYLDDSFDFASSASSFCVNPEALRRL